MYSVLEAYMKHSSDKEILLDLILRDFQIKLWNKIKNIAAYKQEWIWLPMKHLDDARV